MIAETAINFLLATTAFLLCIAVGGYFRSYFTENSPWWKYVKYTMHISTIVGIALAVYVYRWLSGY